MFYVERGNKRLSGRESNFLSWRHFSPRMMTVDARIVTKWIPNTEVEDIEVSSTSVFGNHFVKILAPTDIMRGLKCPCGKG